MNQVSSNSEQPPERSGTYSRLHELVMKVLEDPSDSTNAELNSLLDKDADAQRMYAEYVQETSALRTYSLCELSDCSEESDLVRPVDSLATSESNLILRSRWFGFGAVLAASLAIFVGNYLYNSNEKTFELDSLGEIATVVRVTDVAWKGYQDLTLKPLTRVSSGQELEFDTGQLEIIFDTGVELLVTGPAALSIESPLKVAASRGTFTARVGERGKGFTIDTPATSVIDLGTEFGVSIQDDNATGVVVFDGAVDLRPTKQTDEQIDSLPIRLNQGEALAVSTDGATERIVTMYPGQYPTVAGRPGASKYGSGLFENVTDNLSEKGSKKFYRVVPGGFDEDVRAFVDRRHEWNGTDQKGLPSFLVGGDYVMPFNDNKFLEGLVVSVQLRQSCYLYVLFDTNMQVPSWLSNGFKNTGHLVGLDHGSGPFTEGIAAEVGPGEGIDDKFSVWVRHISGPDQVFLGGVDMPADKELGWNMYGIVAVPLLEVEDTL